VTTLRPDLNYLLRELIQGVPGTLLAVVLSADGLRIAHMSDDVANATQLEPAVEAAALDRADRVAASCSGMQGLADALGLEFPEGGGELHFAGMELDRGKIVLTTVAEGSYLALLVDKGVDDNLLAFGMRDWVLRIGEHLRSEPRTRTV
jgi:predicted regulator of Ras-like GTPase activity (Roadblock/LC7/MglB family)